MIVITIGLVLIAWYAAGMAGGAGEVIDYAAREGKFRFLPEDGSPRTWMFFFAASITMMLGSIPQQDVFQRVMSSNNERTAQRGPIIGGLLYLGFAFVPMFIVVAGVMVVPDAAQLMAEDPQKVLPTLVLKHMPAALQIAFFGALLSAIMSTASATLLAPATTFVENILRNLKPGMSDAVTLKAMRLSVLVFTVCVLIYSLTMEGTSIYELVSGAYQVPLVGAFVPLVFGLYWSRATTQGALLAVVMGVGVWLLFMASPMLSEAFPQQLAGLLAAIVGMVMGSLVRQWLPDHRGHVHHYEGSASGGTG
jgi:Na+/proline symporter